MQNHQISSYIVKLTGNCNLGCPYCYYFGGTPRTPGSRLDINVILKLMNQASQRSNFVELIWHGGEPLIAGIDTFEKIIRVQTEISINQGTKFRNLIQTNGTLLNQQWVNLFLESNFGIGVSLDGPKWIHDMKRPYISGRGSFEQTIRGVQLLQDSRNPFSILAVIDKLSVDHADEIFDFFLDSGFKRFDFLPMVEKEHNSSSISNNSLSSGDFSMFMKRVFDLWFELDDPDIEVRYLDNVITGLLGGKPSTCKFNGSCSEYVSIDHNGTVMPCDNFIGHKELAFGNLYDNSLGELLDGDIRKEFREQVSQRRPECEICDYFSACGGGCNKYSYMWNNSFQEKNYFCGDRWEIFSHVSKHIGITIGSLSTYHINTGIPVMIPIHSITVAGSNFIDTGFPTDCKNQPSFTKKRTITKIMKKVGIRMESTNWSDWDRGYDAWDRGYDAWDKG
ncbi:MAG: SPASM domain-containing protein [Ardenticatenaceae bacterium]|nr:SPASM domain-containing protein [Ardenticatenaceae bacterium]